MRRVGERRLTLVAVGGAQRERRAEVEDGLACAGIEYQATPDGERVLFAVAGGRDAQREARAIIHQRGGQ